MLQYTHSNKLYNYAHNTMQQHTTNTHAHNAAHNFTYDVERLARWDMQDTECAVSQFVNGNPATVRDCSEAAFVSTLTFTQVNTQATPVLVFQQGDTFVAWWDEELEMGYIATAAAA